MTRNKCGAIAVFAGLVLACLFGTSATATTPQPTLTGTALAGFDGIVDNASPGPPVPVCSASGFTYSYSTSGPVGGRQTSDFDFGLGPYPGTFTESGTLVVGPNELSTSPVSNGIYVAGRVLGFTATFRIVSGDTVITGMKSWAPDSSHPFGPLFHCANFVESDSNQAYVRSVPFGLSNVSYDASIVTPAGSFADHGLTSVELDHSLVDTTPVPIPRPLADRFREYFDSALPNAEPTDSTPPVITRTVAGVQGAHGWYTSDVTVAWAVADPDSAVVVDAGCGTQSFASQTAAATSTCSAHSAGGAASDSLAIKIDKTAPTLAVAVTANPVLQNSAVAASPGASDNLSGIDTAGCGPVPTSALGPQQVVCTATDQAGNTSSATASYLVYANVPGGGAFVIGDLSTAGTVTYWGSQWSKTNALSGSPAPSSFKGFATSPAEPACNSTWVAHAGNPSGLPSSPLPTYMSVIVTSAAGGSGSTISGNTAHVVVVKTDPGYDGSPGHAGTGTVVATVC